MNRRHDVGIVAALVVLAAATWTPPPWSELPPDAGDPPGWAAYTDTLLDGFDAGHWAEQVLAFRAGRVDHLDPHRLPTWTLLTLVTQAVTGEDVARAGHLTNHLLRLALGPLSYLAARGFGLRRFVAGLAAAAVVLHPEMRFNAGSFGVDMTVSLAWMVLFAVGLHVDGRPLRAAGAGIVTGLVFAAHITTLPCLVPMGVILARRPGGRGRVLAAWAGGMAATAAGIFAVLPSLDPGTLAHSVWIGVIDRNRDTTAPAADRLVAVLDNAQRTALPALDAWLGAQFAGVLPAAGVAVLILAGILAPGLTPREEPLGWIPRHAPRALRVPAALATHLAGTALPPLVVLAPLPVYFVVGASLRYANTLVPVLVLMAVGGAAAIGARLDTLLPRPVPRLAWALLPLLLVARGLGGWEIPKRGDLLRDEAIRSAAAQIAARWPGDDVATVMKEISASAGALRCPTSFCPDEATVADFERCLADIRANCRGDAETIPYVVNVQRPVDERAPARRAMDTWLLAAFPPAFTEPAPSITVTVVALPRQAAPAGE